jgi:hypothetical protein
MQLRTKVNVTHVDPAKVATGGTTEGIVTMTIKGFLYVENPIEGKQQIQAEYLYTDSEGNVLPTANQNKLMINGEISGTSIDSISEGIGNTANSFSEHFRKDVISYATSEMATLFGILPSDVELLS